MSAHVLVVEDDAEQRQLVAEVLERRGYQVTARGDGDEGLAALARADHDVVITDLNMRGMNGLELCQRVVDSYPELPVIVITGFGTLETAVQAIRAGAFDFVTKPFDNQTLCLAVERALRHRGLTREVSTLRRALAERRSFEGLIGGSRAMQDVYDLIERIADTDSSVLVTGESGTGKELVARAIHQRSRQRGGPFVAINCAAMPEALLESELFGHARGAFTDAHAARTGLFVQASGGTLFLDEIGELPLGLQPKLLRALQERRVRPVGGDGEVPFDARLVSATNRDLEAAVEDGRFREDLFYRVNVIHLPLPPLRARGGDVLVLAQHFLERFARVVGRPVTGISPAAADKLTSYGWPGNIRELSNCIERAVALTRRDELAVEDLPDKLRSYQHHSLVLAGDDPSELAPLEEVERRYILRVLEAVGGSRTRAARTLGLDRKTLYRKLKAYGVADEA